MIIEIIIQKELLSSLSNKNYRGVTMEEKNRDSFLDTLKGFLIILVLIGHFIGDNIRENVIIQTFAIFIYLFHMPFFIFISGYFSKNLESNEKKSFKNLLFLYLIFQMLYGVWELVLHNNNRFIVNIFEPAPVLWYILALFLWKKTLGDILSIKRPFIIIICLYMASFFIPILNTTIFSIGRFLAFLPFFVIGYYTEKKHIDFIKNKLNTYIAISILIFFVILSFLILNYSGIDYQNIINLLCHKTLINQVFDNLIYGVLFDILLIPTAILISISFIKLIHENKTLAYIGFDTLPIYLCHPYIQDICRVIQRKVIYIQNDYLNVGLSLIFILLTLIILSNKYFRKYFNTIINKLKKIVFKEKNNYVEE